MDLPISFEDALARLEEIVKQLEDGELEIEKALTIFEEGTRLSRLCAKKLSSIERRVEVLTKNRDGDETLELFEDVEQKDEE
jgi:exodeoxyribonuclease VII small subunit